MDDDFIGSSSKFGAPQDRGRKQKGPCPAEDVWSEAVATKFLVLLD